MRSLNSKLERFKRSFEIFGLGFGSHNFVCLQSGLPDQYSFQLQIENFHICMRMMCIGIGRKGLGLTAIAAVAFFAERSAIEFPGLP